MNIFEGMLDDMKSIVCKKRDPSKPTSANNFGVKVAKRAELTSEELRAVNIIVMDLTADITELTRKPIEEDANWHYAYELNNHTTDEIVIPNVTSLGSAYIALHECGHYKLEHRATVDLKATRKGDLEELKFEKEANAFALDLLQKVTTNKWAIRTAKSITDGQINHYKECHKKNTVRRANTKKEMLSDYRDFTAVLRKHSGDKKQTTFTLDEIRPAFSDWEGFYGIGDNK